MKCDLSWILPLYKTRPFVEELAHRIREVSIGLGIEYEIIFVDDACPEGSGAEAERVATTQPSIRVLTLSENIGQDSALREGLRTCSGEWAVLLDADLQDAPEVVAELWRRRTPRTRVVFADRVASYSTRVNHATSRLYRAVIRVAGGLPRGACLFVLLHRTVVQDIASTRCRRVSILAAIAAAGVTAISVPIERAERPSGESAYDGRMRIMKAAHSLWQMLLGRYLRVPL